MLKLAEWAEARGWNGVKLFLVELDRLINRLPTTWERNRRRDEPPAYEQTDPYITAIMTRSPAERYDLECG